MPISDTLADLFSKSAIRRAAIRLLDEEAEACAKIAEDCAINSLGLSPKVKATCFAVAKRIRERINARAET